MAKVFKKIGGGIPWARKAPYTYQDIEYEADLKNGDIIKILDSGVVEGNNYGGESRNFKIKTRNGEKKIGINQKSMNVLIDEFGDDTEDWVGKDVRVILKKDIIANKKVIIPYLVTDGWKLDEYGDLEKEDDDGEEEGDEKKPAPVKPKKKTTKTADEDTIEYPEDEIDPEDIPF